LYISRVDIFGVFGSNHRNRGSSLFVIGLMAAAALMPFISGVNKKLITILNSDTHFVIEEFVDKVFVPFHPGIVPQAVANINRLAAQRVGKAQKNLLMGGGS
jgi:hypothetical protein